MKLGACVILGLCVALAGCVGALQRGMLGNEYVSTARPAISASASNLPVMAAGAGLCNLPWTGALAGLPIQVWLALYGEGGLSPLAIVAQAQTPEGWLWEPSMFIPGSVDQGTEVFNGVGYQAMTFIVDPRRDPFGGFITGAQPDGAPQLWVVRTFVANFNFQVDRMILQYREPLPEGIVSLTAIPYGMGEFLPQFEQRAREAFSVGNAPQNVSGIVENYIQGVRWQYMTQTFLGQATHDPRFMGNLW